LAAAFLGAGRARPPLALEREVERDLLGALRRVLVATLIFLPERADESQK
jgi:hypothetical protein